MRERIESLRAEALSACAAAASLADLEEVRVRYLGRRGALTALLRGLGDLAPDERPAVGGLANAVRDELEAALERRRTELAASEEERRLGAEAVDVTLPGRRPQVGHAHPLSQVAAEIEAIFRNLGYDVFEGPEIEHDYYNFEALNIPPDHPAREMQDSFYVTEKILLRTHTSPAQIRYMRSRAPALPVRMIAPGRVYRRDDDATHSPMFHQVEGLLVDRDVSLADLKGTLAVFARRMFGEEARIRLRPSYFPFTEPSAEVDVSCTICGGSGFLSAGDGEGLRPVERPGEGGEGEGAGGGRRPAGRPGEGVPCRTCKGTGWLEVLGAGMVHPDVLANGGYDPDTVSGFAFGMGVERIAMLRYGIDDLRLFFQNDLRFLAQF